MQKNKYIYIGLATVAVLAVIIALLLKKPAPAPSEGEVVEAPEEVSEPGEESEEGGVKIEDTVVGKGKEAEVGKNLTLHYVGKLENGREFDNSKKRDQPFTFPLGTESVLKGWNLGLKGMKVGGKRKIAIPGHLAYGKKGVGDVIPPDATLIFEIELLKVE